MARNFLTRWLSQPSPAPAPHPLETLDLATLRRAEDGSEILYGLARRLEAAGARREYVDQVRNTAHAIYEITQLHPDADTKGEDTAYGAKEHASEINKSLRAVQR
ncbi:MAG: hypothetical protein ACTHXC_12980 [Brachybacterium sp.]